MAPLRILCSSGCGASVAVQAEDASSVTYTCARCALQDERADAVGVPRKSVPKEVREQIKRSLAPAPNDTPLAPSVEEIETSGGTVNVTLRHDPDDITADDVETDKVKRVAVNTPPPDRPRIPRYLKTVPSNVVPTSNPAAPYGLDDDGKPIRAMRSDVEIVRDMLSGGRLLTKEEQQQLAQKAEQQLQEAQQKEQQRQQETLWQQRRILDEKIERLTHYKEYADMKGAPVEESRLSGWGAERRYDTTGIGGGVSEKRPRPYYPALLGLSRQQLVDLLNTPVRVETVSYPDCTQEKIRIRCPLSTALTNQEIGNILRRIDEAKTDLKALDAQIIDSEKLLKTFSVRVMKAQVALGQRAPDDVLGDETLRRLRREENSILKKKTEERDALKKEISDAKKRAEELRRKLSDDSDSSNFVERYPTMTREIPTYFKEIFHFPPNDDFKGCVPEGYSYADAPAAYIQLVHERSEHKHAHAIFSKWRRFENAIITQAVCLGLLPVPSEDVLSKFKDWEIHDIKVPCVSGPLANHDEEDDETDHPEEASLIAKTSGVTIGGQIYAAGKTWSGRPRNLWSFDGPIGRPSGQADGGRDGADAPDDDEPLEPN